MPSAEDEWLFLYSNKILKINMFFEPIIVELTSRILQRVESLGKSILVGLAGSQGSGKSTLAKELCTHIENEGITCIILSLDDFYLTKIERQALASRVHPLFAKRGVPGTHDMLLLESIISSILYETGTRSIKWPKFDKALDDRRTDQENEVLLRDSSSRLVILLEGWCVGCTHLRDIDAPVNQLEREEDPEGVWRRHIDLCIRSGYEPLWGNLDYRVFIQVPDTKCIRKWRMQQAIENKEDLSKLQIVRFIQFFERISLNMLSPEGRFPLDALIELDQNHSVRSIQYYSIEEK